MEQKSRVNNRHGRAYSRPLFLSKPACATKHAAVLHLTWPSAKPHPMLYVPLRRCASCVLRPSARALDHHRMHHRAASATIIPPKIVIRWPNRRTLSCMARAMSAPALTRSTRCLQTIEREDLNIIVKDTPRLERLIIWSSSVPDGVPRRVIQIGHAPALSLVGYLDLAWHVLEVGNTIIKAGTSASPSTMVPSVKILGIRVCFGVRNDAKMLPSFLRCFPNVERLHLESNKTDEPTGKLNNKFWQETGAIECVQSHIKLLIFYGFRGERSELSFLKFMLESARMLTKLVIVVNKGSFTSMAKANSRVKPLFAAKRASPDSSVLLFKSAFESGEEDKGLLNFKGGQISL